MGLFERRDSARDLANLLERERKAILRADFGALRKLAPEKERLIALAANDRPDGERLTDLRQRAARNRTLLEAAAHGIRSVANGLGGTGAPPPELETYDDSGRRSACSDHTSSLERRF